MFALPVKLTVVALMSITVPYTVGLHSSSFAIAFIVAAVLPINDPVSLEYVRQVIVTVAYFADGIVA